MQNVILAYMSLGFFTNQQNYIFWYVDKLTAITQTLVFKTEQTVVMCYQYLLLHKVTVVAFNNSCE